MKKYIVLLIAIIYSAEANHQQGIDTVFSFTPGEGQNTGQGEEYFPDNIFGLPDTNAREDIQSALPENVLSIGFGGEIIVGFKNYNVIDGPGPDFTIFENAFINPLNKKMFAEPGKVAVSLDGVYYTEFPFDSVSLVGCAGTQPTYGKKDPFNPEESGGNQFDLADIGLSEIRYIKITDITRMLLDNPEHEYYDPILSGFDLDALIGLNLVDHSTEVAENKSEELLAIQGNIIVVGDIPMDGKLELYNINGLKINSAEVYPGNIYRMPPLSRGLYIARLIAGEKYIVEKFILE